MRLLTVPCLSKSLKAVFSSARIVSGSGSWCGKFRLKTKICAVDMNMRGKFASGDFETFNTFTGTFCHVNLKTNTGKFWMFAVWSVKKKHKKKHYKHGISSVQCLICSMKCTCWDSRAFAGAGAVCNVHCAVCRVHWAACQRWRFSRWNRISQIKNLKKQLFKDE